MRIQGVYNERPNNRKNNEKMKPIIIALTLSIASLFVSAPAAHGATFLRGELGPNVPAGWEIIFIQPAGANSSTGQPLVRIYLLQTATGKTAVWLIQLDHQ
jgi:hypothetical protein